VVKLARVVVVVALGSCVCCASVLGIDDAKVTVAGDGGGSDAFVGESASGSDACPYVFLSIPWGPHGGRAAADQQCTDEGQLLCPGGRFVAYLPDSGNEIPPGQGTCASADGSAYPPPASYWSLASDCDGLSDGDGSTTGIAIQCPDQIGEMTVVCKQDGTVHLLCMRVQ
jgi:hypothetical protein